VGGDPYYLQFWVNRPPLERNRRFSTNNRKPPISIKNAFRLKKVCYKVFLCENRQRQSCKAFIGLTKCAKIIGGSDPLYQKFWINDRVGAKLPIFDLFSLVAPQP